MITDGTIKITIRSMSRDLFVDELPINFYAGYIDNGGRAIHRKSFRIINREHLVNAYPEE